MMALGLFADLTLIRTPLGIDVGLLVRFLVRRDTLLDSLAERLVPGWFRLLSHTS